VPHYVGHAFTAEERELLSRAFGIGDPGRLYLNDSSATAALIWDLKPDSGRSDMEYSFKLGFVSLRRPGESLADYKKRMQADPSAFPPSAQVRDTALADLDPEVRPLFQGLVEAARARGFDVRVAETYRSPQRQGWLISRADGSTFSGTSIHTYGRAVDFVIDNGYGRTAHNRREYVAFRRFVLEYGKGRLRILGTPSDTWDWGHVEAPAPWLGYHSVEDALAAARTCVSRTDGADAVGGEGGGGAATGPPPCIFSPQLGPASPESTAPVHSR